jgi:tagatose 1,6-diphosphate aldolase
MMLSPGKARGLDTLTTGAGVFAVLAIDHRDSLRAVVPEEPTDAELTEFKLELIRLVGSRASGVMLEPELSLPQAITTGTLPGDVGFSAALEAQGYLGDPWSGPTAMQPGWTALDVKKMGASAAKLLLPLSPERIDHGEQQLKIVRDTAALCQDLDLALMVEPVAFGMADAVRTPTVIDSAKRLTGLGVDILKLEFPGDPAHPDQWGAACAAVTEAATVPWVLLSSGVSFETYAQQLRVAFDNGCSGFTGGRAIWGEAAKADRFNRTAVIRDMVVPRFEQLLHLANERARPWRNV